MIGLEIHQRVDAGVHSGRQEPWVPALLLTSLDDSIIPPEDVREWAEFLRERSGGVRSVTLATLRGTHCMLRQGDADAFEAAVRALIKEAQLDSKDAPIQLARPGRADGIDGGDGAAAVDGALEGLLSGAGLLGLLDLEPLRSQTLEQCCKKYEEVGRTAFLATCKAWGVASLGERQKLTTAVAKCVAASST